MQFPWFPGPDMTGYRRSCCVCWQSPAPSRNRGPLPPPCLRRQRGCDFSGLLQDPIREGFRRSGCRNGGWHVVESPDGLGMILEHATQHTTRPLRPDLAYVRQHPRQASAPACRLAARLPPARQTRAGACSPWRRRLRSETPHQPRPILGPAGSRLRLAAWWRGVGGAARGGCVSWNWRAFCRWPGLLAFCDGGLGRDAAVV